MNYLFAKPSYPLSIFVKQYWTLDNSLQLGEENIQRIIPNGLMQLIFYFGKRPQKLDPNSNFEDNTLLSGQQNKFFDILFKEKLSIFSVLFQPYGTKVFFDIPSTELFNHNIPLKYIMKDNFNELEAKLSEEERFENRVSIVENFLLNLLKKNFNEYELKRIHNSISTINQSKGLISIDSLASNTFLSRKQFERNFLNYIGTSPKQFLKIVRFQNSLFEKQANKNISLTELAYNSGYSDQSHMINEYKTFSGITPAAFFAKCKPLSDYFL